MQFRSKRNKRKRFYSHFFLFRNKTAEEMTEDIVNNQIEALKKLIDNQELNVSDIDVFCEKG